VKTKPPPTKPLPLVEITAIYTGPFTSEQVAAVLAAAAPLPTEAVEDEDIALHCKRVMTPAEAIIRRLEVLGRMAAIILLLGLRRSRPKLGLRSEDMTQGHGWRFLMTISGPAVP